MMIDDETPEKPFQRGNEVIDAFARSLPLSPGVYRMINKKGEPIYIGKARQLQKRVLSYTQDNRLTNRLRRMVAETVSMEAIHTRTEAEALMLEANMIRKFMPRYNVLLRDDKSVPYIFVSDDHPFPQLMHHRGPKNRKGTYYGPFASSGPVWNTIATLQRVFQIRNCTDAVFSQRKRPCMQYHIKRCTAPCVGRVSEKDYGEQVNAAKEFLAGKSAEIQSYFADKMQDASKEMNYELAANYRDKIKALTAIQSRQDINLEGIIEDVDVIAGYLDGGQACIQVFFFRAGRNYGSKAYFPRHAPDMDLPEILDSFIAQFYQTRPAANEILLSHAVPDEELLAEALTTENGRKVYISMPQRGAKKRVVDQAVENAKRAHARNMADTEKHRQMLEKLAELMPLDSTPERVEVYDNSHLGGTNALGVMVVIGTEGFEKKHYRKFNIKGDYPAGDDYAMMREVLTRRLSRGIDEMKPSSSSEAIGQEKDTSSTENTWPDLLIIDGGKGQLSTAQAVLDEMNLTIPLLAISKGPDRNAGREWLHFVDKDPVQLESTDPLLYFLQRIRDEAHRFAITGQRQRRGNAMLKSALDTVPGVGGKRKKALLLHFGSAKAVERAGISDLMKVEGISKATAEMIYGHFHNEK